ncbi:MAG: VCBS repeat-containing protein [Candidatus Sumerlaeia bacterium]|nr:VCBS repeat-containing protein [Candidatus Sumerlaeia bacterium]
MRAARQSNRRGFRFTYGIVLFAMGTFGIAGGRMLAAAQSAQPLPAFQRVLIDSAPPKQPYYKMVGDVTGDGRLDIVIAGRVGPIVVYAAPDWKKSVIAEGGYKGGVKGELVDLNRDGRLDIVMGGVVWFENPGKAGDKWPVHAIGEQNVHDIEVADLNGDGLLDVVARDQSAFGRRGNEIFVFYQTAPGTWKKERMECPHGEGLKLADVNADGKPDIVINGLWYQNDSGKWTPHTFAPEWTEPDTKVGFGDINGDGRPDLVLTPSELKGQRYKISWFECPAGDRTAAWKEHVIVPDIECVIHALALGDFNKDGLLDIAYAEMHQGEDPDEVVVMFNLDKGGNWAKQVIDREGSHDIVAADLDGDGDLDIVGANHADVHPVHLWENQLGGPKKPKATKKGGTQ